MEVATRSGSLLNTWGLFAAGSLAGVFGLPALFGTLPEPVAALAWLAIAFAISVGLLVTAPPIANALAGALRRIPVSRGERPAWQDRAPVELARLVVAAGYVVVIQAILRRPLVAVFGASAEPFVVEAAIGALALLALLALLSWIYAAGKPILEGAAWVALDSAFATSSVEEAAPVASGASTQRAEEATVRAPRAGSSAEVTVRAGDPTVRSPRSGSNAEVTEVAGDPTVRSARPGSNAEVTEGAGDPTVRSSRPGSSDDATVAGDTTQLSN